MRKTFAILLFAIHFFNIYGYRFVFLLFEKTADQQMIAALDNEQYNKNDLMQLKLALNAPYIQSNNEYERCNGQVEHNGIQYNYVMRMVKNDTLYLYCIPNSEKTQLSNSKNLYAKQNADNASGKSEQPVLKNISFLNVYNSAALSFNFNRYSITSVQPHTFNVCTTLKGFTTKHLQPPDMFI